MFASSFQAGWASTDLTPDHPVSLRGQFHARVCEGIRDPLTATALAMEGVDCRGEPVRFVLVGCDLTGIPDEIRDQVRQRVRKKLPELKASSIILNATHTHTAPEVRVGGDSLRAGGGMPSDFGIELPVEEPGKYVDFTIRKIADVVISAWNQRQPGSLAFGLGHAVVGHNRRLTYANGDSRMYGKAEEPDFSHVEGYEDHSLNLIAIWNPENQLSGLVVNVPCPSQVSESEFEITADYWHDTRQTLREKFGRSLFILPQCAAAGDQSPRPLVGKEAEERMLNTAGRNRRREIARRIAEGAAAVLPLMEKNRSENPILGHRAQWLKLTRRRLSAADVSAAETEAAEWRKKYEYFKNELAANPRKREEPRWYVDITRAYRRMCWYQGVRGRFELEQKEPSIGIEAHALRFDDMAVATNPFELYLDYGIQIRGRSPAIQTATVQLTGSGTYLPTERSLTGGGYGSIPASTPVGPEGGRELVENTLKMIDSLWQNT